MSFKLLVEGRERYSLWSTRVDGFLLEDVTEDELREWARATPDGATAPDVDALLAEVKARSRDRAGQHHYDQAPAYLDGS